MDSKRRLEVDEQLQAALLLEVTQRQPFLKSIADPTTRAEVAALLEAHASGTECEKAAASREAAQSFSLTTSLSGESDAERVEVEHSFEGYRLLRVLGQGGMGVVYLAEQLEPIRRSVALKIIKPGTDTEHVVARFQGERQALAIMDHPHIAKVLDAGKTAGGRPYFVMELVDGQPITQYCDAHRLTIRDRLQLFIPVCHAIQHAHQKGVIHRDVKPSNILVPVYDGKAVPKVIDFGVAKATEQALDLNVTRIGTLLGTLAYMSPEQADRSTRDLDTRTDIYSLGAVLYEILTGTIPLDMDRIAKAGEVEVLRCIREVEPEAPSVRLNRARDTADAIAQQRNTSSGTLEHTMRGELDWIVMKALDKDRGRRYASANGLARDLERYVQGEPVEAGPASATYRFRKLAYKHRLLLATTIAFAALLVTATVVSTSQAIRANRERNRAVAALHAGEAERLAGYAREQLSLDPERSLTLAMHAVDATLRFQEPVAISAEGALHSALLSSQVRLMLQPHEGGVQMAVFSPDSQQLLTGGDGGTAKLWDVATGRVLRTMRGHGPWVWGVAFSPDGTHLATTSPDHTATLWDALTGAEIFTLRGHRQGVTYAVFSPDGRRLATASLDHTVRLWDVSTGSVLLVLQGHQDGIWSVAFSLDGKRLVTASDDKTARVWDAVHGRELQTLRGHDKAVVSAAFSPDGARLCTGSADRKAEIWDAAIGRELMALPEADSAVTGIAFSPDGRRIATAGRSPKMWDAA